MVATSLKSLASNLLLAALPIASASALQPRQQQGSPGRQWISFDADGRSTTFSRTVTTIDGAATTLSAQPYSLTGSVYTLIDPAGATYTTTGNPPPPRATDASGGRGYFALCLEGSNSNVQPFCQPRNQAVLYEDTPYYITWDTRAFSADRDAAVHIQLFNVSRDSGDAVTDSSDGVPLRTLALDNETKLSQGYYVWRPTEADLNGHDDFQNLTLRISFNSSTGNQVSNRTGATVAILPKDLKPRDVPIGDDDDDEDSSSGGGGGSGVPAAAIAVPIVIVVLALAGIAAFFLIRRRRREQAAGGGVPNRGSSAFGSRASGGSAQFSQKNNNDIELTTSPTSPRSGGGNVFQEEIERQNRERTM